MRKLNIEVEAIVNLPVRVKFGLLLRADNNANLESVIKQFARGNLRTSKADVEDVLIESAEFDDEIDTDKPLAAHVGKFMDSGGKLTVTASSVTDSR